jgi:hypothetical protein
MKIPLKKTLNILITNFFVKHPIISIYSGSRRISEIDSLKLNYVRTCAKFNFLSKGSFFFKLKYPIYFLRTLTDNCFFKQNEVSLVLFQFYKYMIFGSKNKFFFDLLFLRQYLILFSLYLNNFSSSFLKIKINF